MTKARINDHAIELLARVFNTHKKGVPELMKNAREAYLRAGVPKDKRLVILNYQEAAPGKPAYFECVDFAGISGDDIHEHYLEWAKPDAAGRGLKASEQEGGQGNGGKAYLRQLFDKCFFASVFNKKLSLVAFRDEKKFDMDFVPDAAQGKDSAGDNPKFKVRADMEAWLDACGLAKGGNVTIARGIAPLKNIDRDRLLDDIQQFSQARQTIDSCIVRFFLNGRFKRELKVSTPTLHPMFPKPVVVPIPTTLDLHGRSIATTKGSAFVAGTLELCVSKEPLAGQAISSWNRIDFYGTGVRVIGFREAKALPSKHPEFASHIFGKCTLPLLNNPKDNYELQGRVDLNDGDLSQALYLFIGQEADKLTAQLQKLAAGASATRKRKNLEKLNKKLSDWINTKMSALKGLTGDGGKGGKDRKAKVHAPAVSLKIHRPQLDICVGVEYQLRAVAYDANNKPVPSGRLTWTSNNSSVASINSDNGKLLAKSGSVGPAGLVAINVKNSTGLKATACIVSVHEAQVITIKASSPAEVGTNRRLPLAVVVQTSAGRSIRDPIVSWRSTDEQVVTISPDGHLIGGIIGEADVVAYAGSVASSTLDVNVVKAAAGKPKGGGEGAPQILLSGHDICPFDRVPVFLSTTHPVVFQRPNKNDYEQNVFWLNLQHPLAESLLALGEDSIQWRTYHFQRLLDVCNIIELRERFRDGESLDVDRVLQEMHDISREIYADAQSEIFELLFDKDMVL